MSNEKRLIDANATIDAFTNWLTSRYDGRLPRDVVAEIPTVDAVEVVHGWWEQVDHDGSWRVDRCSICHRRMHYVDYDKPYAYCPNCGAKMDGGTSP